MAAEKRWRIDIARTQGGSYFQIREAAFLDAVGVDLSVGGVASASSQYSGSETPAMAFDKNASTSFSTAAVGVPAWLDYVHPSAVSAAQLRIDWDSSIAWLPTDVGDISVSAFSADGSSRKRHAVAIASGSIVANGTAVFTLTELPAPTAKLSSNQFVFFTVPVLPVISTVRQRGSFAARDVEYGGPGVIYGTTKTKGTPNQPAKARVVLLHQRSKLPVRETWSDPVTGAFAFTGIDTAQDFLVLVELPSGAFAPLAASRIMPSI